MRYLIALMLLLAGNLPAFSQSEPPALLITKAGHYFVVLNDAGEPTLVKITQIIRVGDVPPPNGPDDPAPPEESDVVQKVRVWASEVDHPVGAQALALIYRTIAEKVDDGSLKPEDAFPAIKKATEQVLPTVGGGSKWDDWRIKVGDLITEKLQKGELSHPQHLVKFLNEVAQGLEGSTGASEALNPEAIRAIIELILRLLELFTGTVSPGPV